MTPNATIKRGPTGHRIGESHPHAKLTDDQVRTIRREHSPSMGYERLAKRFGVHPSTIRDICTYRMRLNA